MRDSEDPWVLRSLLKNERERHAVKNAAFESLKRDLFWLVQTVHNGHHDVDDYPGTWRTCRQGVCASMPKILRDAGISMKEAGFTAEEMELGKRAKDG